MALGLCTSCTKCWRETFQFGDDLNENLDGHIVKINDCIVTCLALVTHNCKFCSYISD